MPYTCINKWHLSLNINLSFFSKWCLWLQMWCTQNFHFSVHCVVVVSAMKILDQRKCRQLILIHSDLFTERRWRRRRMPSSFRLNSPRNLVYQRGIWSSIQNLIFDYIKRPIIYHGFPSFSANLLKQQMIFQSSTMTFDAKL